MLVLYLSESLDASLSAAAFFSATAVAAATLPTIAVAAASITAAVAPTATTIAAVARRCRVGLARVAEQRPDSFGPNAVAISTGCRHWICRHWICRSAAAAARLVRAAAAACGNCYGACMECERFERGQTDTLGRGRDGLRGTATCGGGRHAAGSARG